MISVEVDFWGLSDGIDIVSHVVEILVWEAVSAVEEECRFSKISEYPLVVQ